MVGMMKTASPEDSHFIPYSALMRVFCYGMFVGSRVSLPFRHWFLFVCIDHAILTIEPFLLLEPILVTSQSHPCI
jgi:hypothetical protein